MEYIDEDPSYDDAVEVSIDFSPVDFAADELEQTNCQ